MGTNALTLIDGAFDLIGAKQVGEVLPAPDAQDALRRLNQMVAGWRTQFGTVLAIERQVFPVVANQQTYTIGPGGQYNVPRPLTVTGAGLWLNALSSAAAVTGITRVGTTATVTQTAHGYAVGDETFVDGAVQLAYNGMQTVVSAPTANTFTFRLDGNPATPATGTITTASVQGTPVEIPRPVITDDAYQAIQLKNLSNSQFTYVYYNPTAPLGVIFLWPRPSTAANQLVLYLQNVFDGFVDLYTEYDYPDVPGYADALEYNLAVRLCDPYSKPVPPNVARLAAESLGLIKRANNRLTDLPSDAQLFVHGGRGYYNINTGSSGGTAN